MQVVVGMIAGASILACGFILGMLYSLKLGEKVEPAPEPDPDEKPYSKYRNEDGLLSVRVMKSTAVKGGGKE